MKVSQCCRALDTFPGIPSSFCVASTFRDCQTPWQSGTKDIVPSVAEQLRHAREQQKLSVYDIAEVTKIKTDHVRALEEGAYHVFAAPVYIRGFVRSYAAMLKLDVPRITKELEVELSATAQFSQPPNLAGKPHGIIDIVMLQLSRLNWQLLLLIVGVGVVFVLATLSYRGWRNHQKVDPLANFGPGLYPPQTNSGEVLPLSASPAPR
ncbi:MAG: helix-turn-helix domain-containing protein [Pedosphaera sp.]|nr:helix-turn-helix domain-containing protein [Pedosphaera sp.]